jgi:hypothetical protein
MMAHASECSRSRLMNIYVRRGSRAEDKYRVLAGVPGLEPEQFAPGIPPTPAHDLLYHGGNTIPHLTFTNVYVGGDAWQATDRHNIERALAAAMADPSLNNVMTQYFAEPPTSTFKPSQTLPSPAPVQMSQGDVEQLVRALFSQGKLMGFDPPATMFSFMLPRGTVLNDNPAPGGASGGPDARFRCPGVPEEDESNSLNELGGYHGSIQIGGTTSLLYKFGELS